MKNCLLPALLLFFIACSSPKEQAETETPDFTTKFEASSKTETVTYQEGIAFWQKLANFYPQLQMVEYGKTDSGYPLHLLVLSPTLDFNPISLKEKGKAIFLINNAIHPGEPDGIAACQLFVRDLLAEENLEEKLGDVILAIIPFYNIGGTLNRNSTTRANQNGPVAYGFRGNARNYDLNRDFVKADTKNAWSFAEIFQEWQPDIFLDTHVSNGADYQHVMTNLMTQENKLGPILGNFLRYDILPELNQKMEEKHSKMTPYVNTWGTVPDSGIVQFMDSPRYSTGYSTLFHTIGFMTETHMLKPFDQRVEATYAYIESMTEILKAKKDTIQTLKQKEIEESLSDTQLVLSWKLNRNKPSTVSFDGYEGEMKVSEVTRQELLVYNHKKPFTKDIPFYNFYEPDVIVEKPKAYLIPQAWHKVIARLKHNGVQLTELQSDTTIEVTQYAIIDYKTRQNAYEGHYLHYGTQIEPQQKSINFRKGDFLVPTNQYAIRYIAHTLEPQAPDSFFNWNFFDTILQRKEGFSSYVFEAKAEQILTRNPTLKAEFDSLKANDEAFANSNYRQLSFIYSNSENAESAYLRYPVFRVE